VVNNKLVTSFPYLLCRAYFNLAFWCQISVK
jgi:hypothetical protein